MTLAERAARLSQANIIALLQRQEALETQNLHRRCHVAAPAHRRLLCRDQVKSPRAA
jgi:hypothetical protein